MSSPIRWFNLVTAVAVREFQELTKRPQEIFFCFVMPVFWVLMIWGLLYNGVITEVPVAFVNNDHSPMSRQVSMALDSDQSVRLIHYSDYPSAIDALKEGKVYGIIEIPYGYAKDNIKGIGASVSLYLDENRYAVAATIQAGVTTVLSSLNLQSMLKTTLLTGSGVSGAERIVSGVRPDFYSLGNMQYSFLAFLGSNLMPGVIMLAAVLSFVTAFIREVYLFEIRDWLKTASGSFSAAVLGKMLPHFFIFCLVVLAYIGLFAGVSGFTAPHLEGLLIWFVCGVAALLVMIASAVLICAIAPTWRFALVVTSGYAAPTLPFTGFSMPLDSMSASAKLFSQCLPLTWFVQGQTQQWTLGANLWDMGATFTAFALLFVIPLAIGYPLLKRKYRKLADKEALADRPQDEEPPPGAPVGAQSTAQTSMQNTTLGTES